MIVQTAGQAHAEDVRTLYRALAEEVAMKHLSVSAMILALGTTLMAAPQSTTPNPGSSTPAASAQHKTKVQKKAKVKKVKAKKPAQAAPTDKR